MAAEFDVATTNRLEKRDGQSIMIRNLSLTAYYKVVIRPAYKLKLAGSPARLGLCAGCPCQYHA